MVARLWFVPGFGGSVLDLVKRGAGGRVQGRLNLWGGFQQLTSAERWEQLALPQPDPTLGAVETNGICTEVQSYGTFLPFLQGAFGQTLKWLIQLWPYDFRRSARDLGAELAAAITHAPAVDEGDKILAHSYGAAVALAAWAALVDLGQQARVNRITTFGGALYGTHTAATPWAERDDGIDALALVGGITRRLRNPLLLFGPNQSQGFVRLLLEIMTSWPGAYDLLPDPGMSDDPTDLRRAALIYDASQWAPALVQPSQTELDRARTQWWAWIRQAKYIPPSNVLNHIVGTGQLTPARVLPARATGQAVPRDVLVRAAQLDGALARRFLLPTWENDPNGDARCTQAQQALPGHSVERVNALHGSMHDHPGVRLLLTPMLTRVEAAPQTDAAIAAEPAADAYLFNGQWQQVIPPARPVGGSLGAPARIVQLDP